MKALQNMLAAVAFAEAGELETARSFVRLNAVSNKKVILGGYEAELQPEAVRYAMGLCRRVNARLEILHVFRRQEMFANIALIAQDFLVKQFGLVGVDYQVIFGADSLEREVLKHGADQRGLFCVVLVAFSPDGKKAARMNKKKLANVMKMLHCPIVVFSEKKSLPVGVPG